MNSTKELLEKLINGDSKTLSLFIEKYKDIVFNTIISIVQNNEDAQELTQDVFVELYQSAAKFRGDSKISTWLYRIATNKSLDHLKKKKRKKRFAFLTSLFDADSGRQLHDSPNFNHPGILLEQKENAKYLFAAINKLPEKQKTAYVLNKIEGLSNQEVTEVMQLSLSSVDSLLHRAKKNLQSELANYYKKMNE